MLSLEEQQEIESELSAMIGQRYEERGCVRFLLKALGLCGVILDMDPDSATPLLDVSGQFRAVDRARFGDIAVFERADESERYHVAFMVNRRWAYQSAPSTNGVGRIDVTRPDFAPFLRGIYRHKTFDVVAVEGSEPAPCI